ncbi:MAG: HAD family phosphatase [Bacteroidales bacterium]|nr:HAD family phosphatase [Bacteroidales bacterium]
MKNVIFDFGNVLVRWEPEKIYAAHFGDEAKAWWFLRHITDLDWRQRIDAGESQDECIRELQARHPDYADAIEIYRSHWREMLTGEMPGMSDLVKELKAITSVYGLTNWSMETFPEARRHFHILQLIDRYVVSGAEHLVKPDHRLFQVLLDRYNLHAADCIFVDDNPDNVQAANALGMEGIQFTGAEALRAKLGI